MNQGKMEEKPIGEKKEIPTPYNEICRDCLKWQSFGENCFVHWKGKKYCTMKVLTQDDWAEEAKFR